MFDPAAIDTYRRPLIMYVIGEPPSFTEEEPLSCSEIAVGLRFKRSSIEGSYVLSDGRLIGLGERNRRHAAGRSVKDDENCARMRCRRPRCPQ